MNEDDNLIPDSGAEVLENGKPSEVAAKAAAEATTNKDESASPDAGAKDDSDAGGAIRVATASNSQTGSPR